MWKVLIIDDDFKVLEGMKRSIPWNLLEARWVGEAMDGQEGLEKIRETSPDIVITDIYMPVMSGLEMIEQLREEQFQGEVVILSGYSDFQYARQALRLQVSDYLSKPVTMEELYGVLKRLIQKLEANELKKLEQEEIRHRMMMNEPFVQKEWLKSVISGTINLFEMEAIISPFRETNQNYMVIGLELMNTDRLSNLSLTDWSLFRFALGNIIEELLANDWPESEFIELHSHHAVIVFNIDPAIEENEAVKKIHMITECISVCIDQYLKLKVSIGYGGIKRNWRNISDSTEEAFLDLLQRSHVLGQVEPSNITTELTSSIRPIKFYQEITEAIIYSNDEAINQTIEHFVGLLEQTWGMGEITPAYLQYLCRELWTILVYSLYSTGVVLDELFPNTSLPHELMAVKTTNDLRDWLHSKIRVIASNRNWSENSKHKEAIDFMIQYAHNRYAEDINLEDLSKELFLSRNYLNQIFKRATGETFTNYLIRVRMEKAKALLADGKYMIYEISEKVGYKTVPYFSSLFRKHYGMNPSDLAKK